MKRNILTLITIFYLAAANAQDPVTWQYSAAKIGANTYEIHLKATIATPWHLYSQVQPKDAIPQPTQIKFSANPMLSFTGKAKEVGKKEIHKDETIGSTDYRYSNSLDFVQTVKVKANIKTNSTGSITYQVCTDEKCLPPKTVTFNIDLK